MPSVRVACLYALAVAALVAGCSGGGGGTAGAPPLKSGAGTRLTMTIVVPPAQTASAKRRPGYVGSGLQSVVITVLNGTTPANVGANYVNVTSSTSGCTGSGTITCTLSIPVSIATSGTYQVIVGTYDAQQSSACQPLSTPACSGKLLSYNALPETITPGSTTPVSITLGGIPAYLQPVEFLSGYVGNGGGNDLTVYGPGPQKVEFEMLDADKNVIVGAGAPQVSITSTLSSVLNVSVATPNPSGVYVMTMTPQTVSSGAGPIVQPTTVPLNLTITLPGSGAGTSQNNAFAVTVEHSAMYLVLPGFAGAHDSGCNTPTTGVTVEAYLDGNNTSSEGGYCQGAGELRLAVDALGNVWIADYWNNCLVQFPPFMGTGAQGATINAGGGNGLDRPVDIAFDYDGNAYVVNQGTGSGATITEYDAPTPQSTPNFTSPAFTYTVTGSLTGAHIAVDGLQPHIYVTEYNRPGYDLLQFTRGNATPNVLSFAGSSADGLAVEPYNNNVWELQDPVTSQSAVELDEINPATVATITGIPSSASSLAVDMLGNVLIPLGTGNFGVSEYSPPSYSSPVTLLGTASAPSALAVYPTEIFGNETLVGDMPTPLPSPIPMPTF